MWDDLFGVSYRFNKEQRSHIRPREQLTLSSIPTSVRHHSAVSRMSHHGSYNDMNTAATHQIVSDATSQSTSHGSSKSTLPRVHFVDGYESPRRSTFTDPPKINRLHMSVTHRQDVDDEQWGNPSAMPRFESSLKVGGVDWMFKLQRRALDGVPHVGFTLVCGTKLKSALWRITANVKMSIRKKDGEKSLELCYPNNEFTFAAKTMADMIPWAEIQTTIGCDNQNDAKSAVVLTFELQIDITKSYGFRRRARFEYSFLEPSVETDMVLLVENRKLYVNATTETISDVGVEDFLELLNVVYPSQRPVTVQNVEALLKLGDRYGFESVLVKCEDFLITPPADEIDVFTRLEWASKYAMADLQDHCVSKLNTAADVAAVKKTLLYDSLSDETRKLLLELMLKFNNETAIG